MLKQNPKTPKTFEEEEDEKFDQEEVISEGFEPTYIEKLNCAFLDWQKRQYNENMIQISDQNTAEPIKVQSLLTNYLSEQG